VLDEPHLHALAVQLQVAAVEHEHLEAGAP
jgi:hypothetical protein